MRARVLKAKLWDALKEQERAYLDAASENDRAFAQGWRACAKRVLEWLEGER